MHISLPSFYLSNVYALQELKALYFMQIFVNSVERLNSPIYSVYSVCAFIVTCCAAHCFAISLLSSPIQKESTIFRVIPVIGQLHLLLVSNTSATMPTIGLSTTDLTEQTRDLCPMELHAVVERYSSIRRLENYSICEFFSKLYLSYHHEAFSQISLSFPFLNFYRLRFS